MSYLPPTVPALGRPSGWPLPAAPSMLTWGGLLDDPHNLLLARLQVTHLTDELQGGLDAAAAGLLEGPARHLLGVGWTQRRQWGPGCASPRHEASRTAFPPCARLQASTTVDVSSGADDNLTDPQTTTMGLEDRTSCSC